jgi:uncharacterized lipoprotein
MMMIGNSEALPEGGGGSMQSKSRAMVVTVLIIGLMAGCSTGSVTKDEADALLKSSQASRQEWNKIDPQFEAFAKKVMATRSSLRSPKAAFSLAEPTVSVSSTRKANTSVTGT